MSLGPKNVPWAQKNVIGPKNRLKNLTRPCWRQRVFLDKTRGFVHFMVSNTLCVYMCICTLGGFPNQKGGPGRTRGDPGRTRGIPEGPPGDPRGISEGFPRDPRKLLAASRERPAKIPGASRGRPRNSREHFGTVPGTSGSVPGASPERPGASREGPGGSPAATWGGPLCVSLHIKLSGELHCT